MPTQQLDKWFADTFGIDPARFAAPNRSEDPDAAPNQSVEQDEGWLNQSIDPGVPEEPAAPPKIKDKAFKGAVAFSGTLHEFAGPAIPVLGGGLTVTFKSSVTVSGSLETVAPEAARTTKATALKWDDGKIGFEVARTWHDTEGVQFYGWHSFFVECEAALSPAIEDGISIGVKLSGKFGCGAALEIEAVLIKIDEASHIEGFKVSGKGKLPPVDFIPPASLDIGPLVRLVDAKIEPGVEIALVPDWPKLWAELGKLLARDAAVEVVAEKGTEAAVSSAGVDLAIASGFLLIAAVSIAASISAIEHAGDAAKTPKQCADMTRTLLRGYRRGVLGGEAPSGPLTLVGYQEGLAAHDTAVAKLRLRFPEITDDQVQEVLATVVDRLTAEAAPAIEQMAKEKVWQAFYASHQDGFWSGSQLYDRQIAWGGIFGHAPNDEPLFLTGKKEAD